MTYYGFSTRQTGQHVQRVLKYYKNNQAIYGENDESADLEVIDERVDGQALLTIDRLYLTKGYSGFTGDLYHERIEPPVLVVEGDLTEVLVDNGEDIIYSDAESRPKAKVKIPLDTSTMSDVLSMGLYERDNFNLYLSQVGKGLTLKTDITDHQLSGVEYEGKRFVYSGDIEPHVTPDETSVALVIADALNRSYDYDIEIESKEPEKEVEIDIERELSTQVNVDNVLNLDQIFDREDLSELETEEDLISQVKGVEVSNPIFDTGVKALSHIDETMYSSQTRELAEEARRERQSVEKTKDEPTEDGEEPTVADNKKPAESKQVDEDELDL